MKKLQAEKQTFQKFRPYELWHIKVELRNQGKWYGHDCTLKIWSVNSILENNNSGYNK